MKKAIIITWLVLLFTGVAAIFWYTDWIYQLPTPVPLNYKPVAVGSIIKADFPVRDNQKPIFIHFFNPACPCSRFNIKEFKQLYKKYNNSINFVIVVMSQTTYATKTIQDKFGSNIPVLFDPSIAVKCGVYSTPQVALLNWSHKLYYRGNYNRSRYCTDEKTNFAKTAVDQLLGMNARLRINPLALRSYGCRLPNCSL